MKPLHIGIIREEKRPPDKRVPFTPTQLQHLQRAHPRLRICVQNSSMRCFPDEAYQDAGIEVRSDLSHCEVLFGVKEVPIEKLLPEKTYFFFSHTAKQQPHNRRLLQEILSQRIRLIDYEYLSNENGERQVAFGHYAGIVGAHNALWAYGLETGCYQLPRVKDCHNYQDLLRQYRGLALPPLRVVLTGTGRAGNGAVEILQAAGFTALSPQDFLHQHIATPVYTQLSSIDYHHRKDGKSATKEDFHANPEAFQSTFLSFTSAADILIAAAYWNPKAPVLFSPQDAAAPEFCVQLIADITCDIAGSIPATQRSSKIEDPLYNYDPHNNSIHPFTPKSPHITVMAIDNLPCELPKDASHAFGAQLTEVLPLLLYQPEHAMLRGATIAEAGGLTSAFAYLQKWVHQNR